MSRAQKPCGHKHLNEVCLHCEDHLIRVLMDTPPPPIILTPMSEEDKVIRSWIRENRLIERMNENE